MKRRKHWKPGGHPRRAIGSMRIGRRKAQKLCSLPRKGAEHLDADR